MSKTLFIVIIQLNLFINSKIQLRQIHLKKKYNIQTKINNNILDLNNTTHITIPYDSFVWKRIISLLQSFNHFPAWSAFYSTKLVILKNKRPLVQLDRSVFINTLTKSENAILITQPNVYMSLEHTIPLTFKMLKCYTNTHNATYVWFLNLYI